MPQFVTNPQHAGASVVNAGAMHRVPPKDYRDGGADTRQLAEEFKLRCNSCLSVDDLANMGASRLLELLGKLGDKASGSTAALATNASTEASEGDLLRLVAEVQTLIRGASPATLAKLGQQHLENLKSAIGKAEAEVRGNQAADPWSSYSINDVIDEALKER